MSDRNITELEWKKFAKGKGFKDAAFVKALAALETGRTPEAKLTALAEIEKQADALRKANKADKELGSYLDDAEKAAGKERKLQEAEVRKAAPSSSDEEEDSPALLTTKMIPLLRQVKKGEAMQTMVAITGKEVAVLISRKPIGPPRRKLLNDYLGVSGGVKYAVGQVVWEENANTFVLQTQAGGLAKKIKAALYKQTEQRVKVRVRGEDPNDIDDDGEPVEAEAGSAADAVQAGQAVQAAEGAEGAEGAEAAAPAAAATAPAPPPAADPARIDYEARWARLAPRVDEALATGHAEATKLGAVAAFVAEKAAAGNFKSAGAGLDQLEKFLSGAPPAVAASSPAPAPTGRVDYAKCRLAWEAAKKKAHGEYQKLEAAILQAYAGDPALADIAAKVRRLDTVLGDFADDLSDTLDRALNAAEPAERERRHSEASATIRRFLERSAQDPFIRELETNPFVPITAQATLVNTLGTLARLIA